MGIPITLTRTYRSTSSETGALGSKWQHSYESHLTIGSDGTPTWVNDRLQRLTFVPSGALSWRGPAGWHEVISATPTGYELRFDDGRVHGFGLDGRLLFQRDPNGNEVDLHYAPGIGGKLLTVTDATGRAALTFAYDPATGLLASVTDLAGRTVRYQHRGTDLIRATDVLGETETYTYADDHLLLTKTDAEGSTWTELYDADGRWTGYIDPDGERGQVVYDMSAKKAAFIDRTGKSELYEWNEAGNPLVVTDPLGERRVRTFDAEQNLLTDTDGRGSTYAYRYDTEGRRTRQTDPEGRNTSWTYEPAYGRLKQTTYPDGRRTTNAYDQNGNLQTSTDEKNQVTTYAYTTSGQLETITQPGGASTTLTYDASGSVATMTDPEGGTTRLGYDAAGHLTSMTDPNGTTRTMTVDAKGQVTSMVDAEGHATTFTYDGRGNRLTSTDARGATSSFTYDAQGRLTSTTDTNGATTRTEYDAEGRVTARVDARGGRTEMRYDAAGRLIETIDAGGGVTSYGYCADLGASSCSSGSCGGGGSQVCELVDPEGRVTRIAYDAMGRKKTTTDPLGNTSTTTYDTRGRVAKELDPEGHAQSFLYEATGALQRVTDAIGATTSYGYDPRGNRVTVKDANTKITTFAYDAANRLTSETNPLGNTVSFTYDLAGNRRTKTDQSGRVTTYVYDGNRRLLEKRLPPEDWDPATPVVHRFGYDETGNRTYEQTPASERERDYDSLGRQTEVRDITLHKKITYEYDANGNRTKETVASLPTDPVPQTPLVIRYTYDAMNRLVEVTDPTGGKTRLSYDQSGRRTSLTFGNGIAGTYGYDGAGRLNSIVYVNPRGEVVEAFIYTLDRAGNRLSKQFADGRRETYGYDAANRLTEAVYRDGRKQRYTLDRVGNRRVLDEYDGQGSRLKHEAYTHNAFNQILTRRITTYGAGATTTNELYGWDLQGAMTSVAATTGATTETTTYTYNSNERLSRIAFPASHATPDSIFAYDANEMRIAATESIGKVGFLLDGPHVRAGYSAAGVAVALNIHNPQGIDELISVHSIDGGRLDPTRTIYPIVDALGSTYSLANSASDVDTSYEYDVYGQRQATSGNRRFAFGFTGREHGVDSGIVYYRYRNLNPSLSLWTRSDPAGMVDGPRVYGYVNNNPIGNRDPGGLRLMSSPLNLLFSDGARRRLDDAFRLVELAGCRCAVSRFDGRIPWEDGVVFVVLDPSVRGIWDAGGIANPTYWPFLGIGYIYLDPSQDEEKMAQTIGHEVGHLRAPYLGHDTLPLRFEGEKICGNYSRELDRIYAEKNCGNCQQ